MKRLVVCCDGTWNKPDNVAITNIEKIARTIQTDAKACDDVQQLVLYVGGVGIGYKLDRLLGGAFGSGLFNNVKTAYRFLALNYEPGDEIFVFGFSRGAYTARSLVGMIGLVGLLTRRSLIADKLPEAVNRYQRRGPAGRPFGASNEEFKRDFCHPQTPTKFLGVFDTVGALGVPGTMPKDHQFHDIRLGDSVLCARQALAIDDRRITFEPCLWDVPVSMAARVKQVWFPGGHSDVGGGARARALSDTALLWMVGEAIARGLSFAEDRLFAQLHHEDEFVCRFRPGLLFGALNLLKRMHPRPRFRGDRRVLAGVPTPPDTVDAVYLAQTAAHLTADPTSAYARHARNVAWWRDAAGPDLAHLVEPIPGGTREDRPLVLA